MLSSVDFSGFGEFIIFHVIVLIITGANLITGLLMYRTGTGKLLILIAVILGMYLVMGFKFGCNPPWNFWDR